MSTNGTPGSPDDQVSALTLTGIVRDLAVGRKSLTTIRVTQNGKIAPEMASDKLFPAPETENHRRQVDSENAFKEKYLLELAIGRPIKQRILAARAASKEILNYSADTIMAIWAVAEELSAPNASLDSRKAGYELLAGCVGHSGLDLSERERLFEMIIVPLAPAYANLQVVALNELTQRGKFVAPFGPRLVTFLNSSLQEVFEAALKARRDRGRAGARARTRPSGFETPLDEDVGLVGLLRLVEDIIKHSPEALDDANLKLLVNRIVEISTRTAIPDDLTTAVNIIELLVLSSQMPVHSLEPCIEVLCAISSIRDSSSEEAPVDSLRKMLRTKYKTEISEYLLSFLSVDPGQRKPHVVRGAFITVEYLLEENGASGLPTIPLKPLCVAFKSVWSVSSTYTFDCLRILRRLLHGKEVFQRLLLDDWAIIGEILYGFAGSNPGSLAKDENPNDINSVNNVDVPLSPFFIYYSGQWSELKTEDALLQRELRGIATGLGSIYGALGNAQRLLAINIFLILSPYLDHDVSDLIINYMVDESLVFPSNKDWLDHLSLLVRLILFEPSKADSSRRRVLDVVKKVYTVLKHDERDSSLFDSLGLRILRTLKDEVQLPVINALADFATEYARHANMEVFKSVIETLTPLLSVGPLADDFASSALSSNLTTCYLVRLFLQCLPRSAMKTTILYQVLVSVAANIQVPHPARLTAMKLLTRLRCDANHAIKVVSHPDSLGLAAALCRTKASYHRQTTPHSSANRVSFNDEAQIARTGRSSAVGSSRTGRSRSTTRSTSVKDRASRATPPLWMYGALKGLPVDPPAEASTVVFASSTNSSRVGSVLNIGLWMEKMNDILLNGDDWEIYSYILVHLPSQLGNITLFESKADHVHTLHALILRQLDKGSFHAPPTTTGVKQGDVALCLFHTLTILVGYHERCKRGQLEETISAFLSGIGKWDRVAKCCIHALTLCCHELPVQVDRYLKHIVQKMSQIITQAHLAMDVLEFLAGLARLPDAYRSNDHNLFQTIFGISVRYLHHAWEQRHRPVGEPGSRTSFPSSRYSTYGEPPNSFEATNPDDSQKGLPEYVSALAYHAITSWFLAINIRDRPSHVGWISKSLAWKDGDGIEIMEEQSQVTLDMMHRTTYLDLGETMPNPKFGRDDDNTTKQSWLIGLSIVTIETFKDSGLSQITKRQASGTTHAIYQQHTAPLPPHHTRPRSRHASSMAGLGVLPNHILLQQTSTISPMPIPMQPIVLPDDDSTRRAIKTFDFNDTVDGHKAGVIYVGKGQRSEADILANTHGTSLYNTFLSRLGTKVVLQGATFNTQGLDRVTNRDGTHTYAWRDRVIEIVFHITTMMPTNVVSDPQCIEKKRHIGNDFVNIIYNDSGMPFDFDTFKTQYNYFYIVVTPEFVTPPLAHHLSTPAGDGHASDGHGHFKPRFCFTVQTIHSPSFPEISPTGTPKLVSACALSGFVRQLALSASVFSLVSSSTEGGGEYVSSWQNRLKQIMKLRERYANTGVSANVAYPEMGTAEDRGGARSYVDGDEWKGTLTMGGLAEEDQRLLSLDFTRWA